MTDPSKQRKVWPFIAIFVLVAFAGLGYYLDPEGEIVQEVSQKIHFYLNNDHQDAASFSSETTTTPVPPSVILENHKDQEEPHAAVLKAEESQVEDVAVVPEDEETAEVIDEPSTGVLEEGEEATHEQPDVSQSSTQDNTPPPQQQQASKVVEFNYGDLRAAVGRKDSAQIAAILHQKPDLARVKDSNGWTILHEAARSGLTESVKALVEQGQVDIAAKAGKNGDLLALDIALRYLKSEDHPTVVFLRSEMEKLLVTSKKSASNEGEETAIKTDDGKVLGPSSLLEAAIKSDFVTMAKIVKERPQWVDKKDANGWNVLHEMARAGRLEAVKFLVTEGNANVNSRTSRESNGGSVLYHATNRLGSDHPVVRYLVSVGAKLIAPGEKDEL